jgi:hypothetical protein
VSILKFAIRLQDRTDEEETNMATSTFDKLSVWAGRIISALPALFLLFDGIMKLVKPPLVVEATAQLGYKESVIVGLGVVLIACTILYLIPRTAVLGAILLTGYWVVRLRRMFVSVVHCFRLSCP